MNRKEPAGSLTRRVFTGADQTSFLWHRGLGFAMGSLGLLALVFALCAPREGPAPRRRRALRITLVALAVTAGSTGFFGGELVNGAGHLWP